jgi:glycine cleavage system H lipoate-binding protein
MVPAILTITVAVIFLVNFAVYLVAVLGRAIGHFFARRRALRAVRAAGSSLEYPTLRRVHVSGAAEAVLALSGDPTVLGRVRRTLVLAGYRVDTVESAVEAEQLLAAGGYDLFVAGPDQEPAMVASLVGVAAVDVVSLMPPAWPLRDRQLRAQVRGVLARRAERLAAASRPKAELVTVDHAASPSPHVINVPAGLFIASNHTWVALQPNGEVRVGLDEFVAKLVASTVDDVDLPLQHERTGRTAPLFSVHRGAQSLDIESPIDGRVTAINDALEQDPELLNMDPYTRGWVCCLKAENLARDLAALKLGEQALEWYTHEIERHVRAREAERAPSRTPPLAGAVVRA